MRDRLCYGSRTRTDKNDQYGGIENRCQYEALMRHSTTLLRNILYDEFLIRNSRLHIPLPFHGNVKLAQNESSSIQT
jgi:hypothetical protein